MIKRCRKLAFMLVLLLCANLGVTAVAADAAKTDSKKTEKKELTEEEKKAKEELDKAYKIPIESNTWAGWSEGPGTYGEAAIVMDVATGAVLYAKNIDAKEYPASITKVLTALVALENGTLTDTVTFSHDCVSFLQPGDSSVGLKEGNVITLEQALYATLLASANEAAYAVGENVGKNAGYDYNWFIDQMNTRTAELGGVNSHFANTNGLHYKEHYTCARDMALIGRELFKHPEFFQIVQTLEYKIPKSKTVEEHVFQQKDKMLRPENENYYKYAIGGKTGFTSDARSTLITMAQKGDMQVVCVVLRTYGKNVYPDTRNLLKYAFKNFSRVNVEEAEQSEDVSEFLEGENYVILPKGAAFTDLEKEVTIDGGVADTGTLTYTYQGTYVGSARVKFSEAYLEEHLAGRADAEKEEEELKEKVREQEEEAKETGILANPVISKVWNVLGLGEKSRMDLVILAGAAVLLAGLIIAFIAMIIRRRILLKRLHEDADE